jgi:hypothetical protein
MEKSLQTTKTESLRRIPRKRKPASPEAFGASRGLFHVVSKARSLKTQQRAFTSRRWSGFGWNSESTLSPSFGVGL